jgi:hypothetical protein
VCNLYSMTKGQPATRALARAMRDQTGNMPPLPGIFPDHSAPIVHSDPGMTNVRNTASPDWRRWLGVDSRCVVSFTAIVSAAAPLRARPGTRTPTPRHGPVTWPPIALPRSLRVLTIPRQRHKGLGTCSKARLRTDDGRRGQPHMT